MQRRTKFEEKSETGCGLFEEKTAKRLFLKPLKARKFPRASELLRSFRYATLLKRKIEKRFESKKAVVWKNDATQIE